MDKNIFIEKYNNANVNINKEEKLKIELKSIDNKPIDIPGIRNLIIVIEECSELIQVLSDKNHDRFSLIEEMSDVEQGLDYIEIICNLKIDKNYKIIESYNTELLIYNLACLQQCLTKYLRGKNNIDFLQFMLNKIFSLLQIAKMHYGISNDEINKAMNVKIDRLNEINGVYK